MIHLAEPYVTNEMREAVFKTLGQRFIGQGPQVDQFEQKFQAQLRTNQAVAVGSGTDALHLSYILAGIKPGDEVAVPVFTCTATNLPLLWMGAKLVFIDVDPTTLNIDIADLERKLTKKTKAIVAVDYAGQPCDYAEILDLADDLGIPVIDDAAHAVGATYHDNPIGALTDYTTFSFQAIKHITTCDGGMLTLINQVEKAKLLRWFGIDRNRKLENLGHWTGDITEIGYKYQMTDVAASMGIASLDKLDYQLDVRRRFVRRYRENLKIPQITLLDQKPDRKSADWLMTVLAEDRDGLRQYLLDNKIESSPFHYRNDRYTIFKDFANDCPNMDEVENKILCIPLHMNLRMDDIYQVIEKINNYYE